MDKQQLINNLKGSEIAVVGMAGRFPGAKNVDTFWVNLRDGVEALSVFSDDQLRAEGVDEGTLRHPHYVKAGMVLDEMEMFDAGFFGFSPRDAAIMDPQHRHFIEVAWEALEHAGYDPKRFNGAIGVFGGSGMNAYMPYNLFTNPELMQSLGLFLVRHTGNDKDFLTTRVSYLFDLKGPSVNVQTACSTSLVAIHLACQSLINFECDMALAGGATIELPHRHGYRYQEGEILSPDGHCRSFDHRSEGTVFGSGVGVVTLRRLEDALQDGDTIHAIIRGSAVNNDGSGKMNYFAPSVDGQSAAIAAALAVADVPASTVSYVETHGTGTPLGDPIEITALTKAFRTTTDKTNFCGIGSVKTNIGHLDTAAGVASFIKVVQALKHGQLPPSLNFERPNPMIDFANSPFYVNDRLTDWRPGDQPRRAGVSSLGVGGTNAHIVLEEAPLLETSGQSRDWKVLTLSAKTPTALDKAAQNLADYLENHPEVNLADAAYTLQVGRQEFAHRRTAVVNDHADAIATLRGADKKRVFSGRAAEGEGQVAFMFPGGGAQYPNMGRGLYESEPVYREIVDNLLAWAKRELRLDLKSILYPNESNLEAAALELEKPLAGLAALFITEYAMARLWMSWGIQPAALTGHSMGEYTAACLAGVLSPEDALSVVALRGRLFESLPKGAMVSIPLPEREVLPLLVEGVSVSVVNSPSTCVVSGSEAAIEAMERSLTEHGINYQRVKISVAAHSPMLDPILDEFRQHMSRVPLKTPTIPFISNLSGTWVNPADATNPQYWVDHLRHTVRFADGIATLMQNGDYALLEVGPGNTLGSLARDHHAKPDGQIILSSIRHPREVVEDVPFALTTLGRLWTAGQIIDWTAYYDGETRYRIPLTTYPFEHQRYWIEPGKGVVTPETGQARISKLADMNDWFYKPVWKPNALENTPSDTPLRWLVFLDTLGLGKALAKTLEKAGHEVFTVQEEPQYSKTGQRAYGISPRMREDYFDLLEDMIDNGGLPHRIIHLWAVTGEKPAGYSRVEFYEKNRDNLFYSLLFLTQALTKENLPHPIEIGMISNGMQDVKGEGLPHPEKAILLGPCRVIPHEYANLSCRSVDVVMHKQDVFSRLLGNNGQIEALAQQLMAEFTDHSDQTVVAYRDGERWTQTYEPARLSQAQNRLREGGVYLITGGLGGIGLTQAEYLAKTVKAKLVLIGRSALPAREEWEHWLRTQPAGNKSSQQIRKVLELEAAGAEVLVAASDVSNRKQLGDVIDLAVERFGTIHGVIHAAGTIDDNLIHLKTAGAVERVLAPKVRGALLLDELLDNLTLDFFILFSSTSTILGPVGQADYAAANAFLDAFAHHKRAKNTHTITLNWGMWQEVGMAVNAAQPNKQRMSELATAKPGNHPLLEYCTTDTADEIGYTSYYSTDHHWILDQHRLKDGTALLPGTGYLEIARAAIGNGRTDRAVGISNLTFISPLQVAEGEQREVHVGLHRNGNGYELAVNSRSGGNSEWLEHAHGKVSFIDTPTVTERYPLDEIIARCNQHHISYAPGEQFTQQEEHLLFGARWKVLREVYFGQDEALALLELPADFIGELDTYSLHPALLDLATGFGLPLTEGYTHSPDLYVPFSYGRVRMLQPLAGTIYSHARYKGQQNNTTTFDITLVDTDGCVLVEIEDFMMKRMTTPENLQSRKPRTAADNSHSGKLTLLDVGLTDGIRPDEGVQVLERVLSSNSAPQVVATSLSLDVLAGLIATSVDVQPEGKKFTRPAVGTEYVEPRDELEATLARIWENALGIEMIGVYDDFFELGGQSLIAIRLLSQFRKELGVDLPVVTFFEAPTIAQCAERIRAETNEEQSGSKTERRRKRARQLSSLVAIQPNGSKIPFFCVHGAGGNVMVFSVLSDYLGLDQPFYGLQEQGVDGNSEPLDRIEDMAALYIKEIREVYPHGPYLLGGFSMGGEVAFEMAQQLIAAGEEVRLLVLFDTLNPVRSIRMHSFSTQTAATKQGRRPGKITAVSRKMMGHIRRLSKLTPRQQADYLSRDARMRLHRIRLKAGVQMAKASGKSLPYKLIEEQLWETNLKAVTNYMPRLYPGKITLFRASENLDTNRVDDPMGWGALAAGGVEEYIIDGTHRLLDEPYVVDVVRQFRICLDDAQKSDTGQ